MTAHQFRKMKDAITSNAQRLVQVPLAIRVCDYNDNSTLRH